MLTAVLRMPPRVPAASSRSASENFIRSQDPPVTPGPAPVPGVIPIAPPPAAARRTAARIVDTYPPDCAAFYPRSCAGMTASRPVHHYLKSKLKYLSLCSRDTSGVFGDHGGAAAGAGDG